MATRGVCRERVCMRGTKTQLERNRNKLPENQNQIQDVNGKFIFIFNDLHLTVNSPKFSICLAEHGTWANDVQHA